MPTAKAAVAKVATPPARLWAVPIGVPSSLNCTLPPGEKPLTVEVKLTVCPTKNGGNTDKLREVADGAKATVTFNEADVLALFVVSPE